MPPGQPPYPPPGDAYYQPVYPRFAGFWIRFAAFLIDGLIISLAFLPLNVIFTALDHDIPIYFVFWGLWLSPKGVDLSLLIIFNITRLLILYAYFIVLTGRYGATYGKMILKIKVVMEDLSRVSYGKAALRETVGKWVCYISLLIGFIWIGFDSRKQGWQDKIAHTIVIYE